MDPILRSSIAKIEVKHGGAVTSRGTGTLVAHGLVLTALHVVGDRMSAPVQFLPGEIVLTFPDHTTRATPVDGMCDGVLDWALLRCDEPPKARPVPLGEIRAAGAAWTTYGFPDAQPLDGMVQAGTVRNAAAQLGGAPTYQLFSEEASAGRGAPVKGLSGGPVLVDGALVGVLRFALMNEGQAVAGTLYACPARLAVESCDGLLPIPDPCHGLPGLPRRPLPEHPYRYLSRYREEDAEVFFGRDPEIRDVFQQITDEDGMGVVLFYGQTGVGKSSFLDAGLVPRLRWTHNVRYLRREATRSLVATLRRGLTAEMGDEATDDGHPLPDLWRAAEEHGGKPIVVILDQVEEVYTRRHRGRGDEISELGHELRAVFHGDQPQPSGQIVLGFRKEWYPEVQQRLEEHGVGFSRVFLETLREEGVAETVSGLTRTRRLRDRYGVTVAPELPAVIAGQLHEDDESPIAPTLQILLAKMWFTACADNAHAPALTLDLYTGLKREGALLGDFLDQQISRLTDRRASAVESGLILDVLARHTTPMLTADERSGTELREAYGHHDDFEGLLVDMQEMYLLVDAGPDAAGAGSRSRLAHDTLAPLVRQRYDDSARPGQAAARILQSRVPAGAVADELVPLDDHDLQTVESGLPGMRALGPIETKLVARSCEEREQRRRTKKRVRRGFVAMLVVLAFITVFALGELRAADRERQMTKLSNTTDKVRSDLVSTPINGLVLSFWAVCRSLDKDFHVANELQMSLSTALETARETHDFEMPAEVNSLTTHPREPRFVVALENGYILRFTRRGLPVGRPYECYDADAIDTEGKVDGHDPRAVRRVAYSPDGSWLYAIGNDGRLRGWQPGVPGAQVQVTDRGAPLRSLAISPDGERVATGGSKGTIRVWSADTSSALGELRAAGQRGGVNALAFTPDGRLVAGGDDGVIRIWDLDHPEEPPTEVRRHEGPILALDTVDSHGSGSLIASGGADETVRLFHGDGTPLQTRNWLVGAEPEHELGDDYREVVIADHTTAVRCVAFNRVGAHVLSGDEQGVVMLNSVFGEPAARPLLGPDAAVRSISYYPDGVALIGGLDHSVRSRTPQGLILGSDLRPLGVAMHPDDPGLHCVEFSDDGSLVAVGDSDGWVTIWDLATRQIVRRHSTDGARPVGLVFCGADVPVDDDNAEGEQKTLRACEAVVVACGDGDDGVLWLFSPDPEQEPREIGERRARLTALAGTRSGRIVVGGVDGSVRVVELHSGAEDLVISEGGAEITAVAVSSDGRRLAFARADSEPLLGDSVVELWEYGTGWTSNEKKPVLTHHDNHGVIYGLAFSGDGKVLYSAGADGKLRIRAFETGKKLHAAQKAHLGVAHAVAATADGARVVTGGSDGRIVLWGVSPPNVGGHIWDFLLPADHTLLVNRIAEFVPAHRWAVRAVAFGGENQSVAASASTDGSLRLWSASYEAWLEAAAARLREHPPNPHKNEQKLEALEFLETPPWIAPR